MECVRHKPSSLVASSCVVPMLYDVMGMEGRKEGRKERKKDDIQGIRWYVVFASVHIPTYLPTYYKLFMVCTVYVQASSSAPNTHNCTYGTSCYRVVRLLSARLRHSFHRQPFSLYLFVTVADILIRNVIF